MRMVPLLLCLVCLGAVSNAEGTPLKAGVGIADATGPVAEISFMGYGKLSQKGNGLHLRQFARTYIFDDGTNRLALVSVDCGMIGDGVRNKVLRILEKAYGGLYTENNVMISGSHTHSTPGGHMFHMLFDITILGFSRETFNALVSGIVKSIVNAHNNIQPAKLFINKGDIHEANINRSPTAYQNNPEDERKRYKYNVDKEMIQLKVMTASGAPMGAMHWFPVHPTSMNNTNTLVSSDNVGLAAVLFEQKMNPDSLIGKGPFVAAFGSTNLGDVSPNTRGPKCQMSGNECDTVSSKCDNSRHDECVASGPGKDMFESTRIIAGKLFDKAKELWDSDGEQVFGPLKVIHQYIDMPTQSVTIHDAKTGQTKTVQGCLPAMGYSFGAGTTDGPGASPFSQSTTSSNNPLWNSFRDFLVTPRKEDIDCHAPKPILIPTGRMTFPYAWQPRIVSTQLALLDGLALACVPGELTTMAGRRLRKVVHDAGAKGEVAIVGVCNTYSDYVTTFEEYQAQRYEGASTVYGPYTLDIYLQQYKNLTKSLLQNFEIDKGPVPPDMMKKVVSVIPPVIFDTSKWAHEFGDVVRQPKSKAKVGDKVSARFVSGHPRNDIRHEDTYLTVERKDSDDVWTVVATDANWETKFYWIRISEVLGTSEAEIEWHIPDTTEPGEYRIRHFGVYKYVLGGKYAYQGTTSTFTVSR